MGAERHLFRLGEEIVDGAVEHETADRPNGDLFLGNELGGVENVELEVLRERLVEHLQAEFPLRAVAALDGFPQVAAVIVRIGAVDLHGFVPHHRLDTQFRLPVKLDEMRPAVGVDQPEGMDAEPFHEPERTGNRAVRHDPHHHVHAFGHQRNEVPKVVVSRLRLWKAAVGRRLDRVNEIRKLDGVLDKEHGHVVADDVPVPLLSVELDGEAANVAGQIHRALVSGHGGEPDECRDPLAGAGEHIRLGDVGQ